MDLIDQLQPVRLDGGFSMDDWWIWDGSVIKGEDILLRQPVMAQVVLIMPQGHGPW